MRAFFLLSVAAVTLISAPAMAATTIGNTGIDSNWKVGFLGDTATVPTDAQASSSNSLKTAVVVTTAVNNWISSDGVSKWVSSTNNAQSNPGYYAYSNSFTAAAADVLTFDFAVDDKIERVLLNGVQVAGALSGTYTGFSSASVSGFKAGANTLTFLTSNNIPGQNANVNPSGFRFKIAPMAAVPEPATWMTMLLGFGLIGGTVRNRRRHGNAAVAAA